MSNSDTGILTREGVKHAIWDAIQMKLNLQSRPGDSLPTTYNSESGTYSFNKTYGAWTDSIWLKSNYDASVQDVLKIIISSDKFTTDIKQINVIPEGATTEVPITSITDKTKFINCYVDYFMSGITLNVDSSMSVPKGAVSNQATDITINERGIIDAISILKRIANIEYDLANIKGINYETTKFYEELLRPQNIIENGYDEILITSDNARYSDLIKIANGETPSSSTFTLEITSELYHYFSGINPSEVQPPIEDEVDLIPDSETSIGYNYTIHYDSSKANSLQFEIKDIQGDLKVYDVNMIILDLEGTTNHLKVYPLE